MANFGLYLQSEKYPFTYFSLCISIEIIELLIECDKNFQVILTKTDKVNVNEKYLVELKDYLATLGCLCNVLITSSKNGIGEKELQLSMVQSIK